MWLNAKYQGCTKIEETTYQRWDHRSRQASRRKWHLFWNVIRGKAYAELDNWCGYRVRFSKLTQGLSLGEWKSKMLFYITLMSFSNTKINPSNQNNAHIYVCVYYTTCLPYKVLKNTTDNLLLIQYIMSLVQNCWP